MQHPWRILLVTSSILALLFLNSTMLPVALPTLQRDLEISNLILAWVLNAYILAASAFLFLGGGLVDWWGVRWTALTGFLLLAAASIGAACSLSGPWLIGMRALQGMGSGLVFPLSGSLIILYISPKARGRALGTNAGIGSIFLVLGPLLGGLFTQYLSWRWLFLLNLPILAVGGSAVWVLLPPSRGKRDHFDIWGALLLACLISSLTIALVEGKSWGWSSPLTLSLLVLGLTSALLFFWNYRRVHTPILDLALFKRPLFSIGTACLVLTQLLLMVTIFWALHFQIKLEFSPFEAGILIMFATLPVAFFAPFGGHLADRFGSKLPVTTGFGLIIFSLVWLALLGHSRNLILLLIGLLPFGSGIPMIFAPGYVATMEGVEPVARATALILALRQLGASLGLAVMSALFLALERSGWAFAAVNAFGACMALIGLILGVCTLNGVRGHAE